VQPPALIEHVSDRRERQGVDRRRGSGLAKSQVRKFDDRYRLRKGGSLGRIAHATASTNRETELSVYS